MVGARVIVQMANMITKTQILTAGSSALMKAFHDWLDENRESILQIIAQALVNSGPKKPTESTASIKSTDRVRQKKQKAPARSCDQTEANWGLGVRHSLFPMLTLGAPLRGCQLPDAILHGKRNFRPHSRAVQRLAVTELLSEAS